MTKLRISAKTLGELALPILPAVCGGSAFPTSSGSSFGRTPRFVICSTRSIAATRWAISCWTITSFGEFVLPSVSRRTNRFVGRVCKAGQHAGGQKGIWQ